jgi:hypothetical protein
MQKVTLAKITKTPDLKALQAMKNEAFMNQEQIVALPFERPGENCLMLAITYSSAKRNIPRWYLFAGVNDGAPILWVRDTANAEEIQMLLPASKEEDKAPAVSESPSASLAGRVTSKLGAENFLEPAGFDQVGFDDFKKRLLDDATGMYARGSFTWFINQEHHRYQRIGVPFAVIALGLRAGNGAPLLPSYASALVRAMGPRVRAFDYFCQEGEFGCLVLPGGVIQDALVCCKRLIELADAVRMADPTGGAQLFAGVSAMPEVTEHPGVLISSVRRALQVGMERGLQICAFERGM